MPKSYWLVKQEPSEYSWETFVKEGRVAWTGVRNYAARLHLRAMQRCDWVCFYHSGEGKEVVGLAEVAREAYPDPTAEDGDWSAVDLKPLRPMKHPVPLARIKADAELQKMAFVRQSRLSVSPVTADQFARLVKLEAANPTA